MRIDFSLSWLKNLKSVVWVTGVGTVLAQTAALPVDPPPVSQAPMPVRLPEIEVTAPYEAAVPVAPLPAGAPLNTYRAATSAPQRERVPDSATFLQSVPGAAVVRNGPQTGIVQLRGLSGDRVKVSVDGANITPACPNHMDPPLHYAAPTAVEAMTVMAGVTPVSLGGDSIAGTVLVETPAPRFATNAAVQGFGGVGGFFRSSNDGYGFQGEGGVADREQSASYRGSWQTADDLRFPGGRVRDTGYDIQQHQFLAGVRTRHGVWSADAGWLRTRDAGTPALPMDMIEDEAWRAGVKHDGQYAFGLLAARFYYHTIDHLMDNYSLRPALPGGMRMFSPATSIDTGGRVGVTLPRDTHTFLLGAEGAFNWFEAYQQNAVTGAQQDTLPNAHRYRVGAYAEWQADWDERWTTLLGLRHDSVLTDAGKVQRFFPPAAADAARFNARDPAAHEPNFDVTAAVRFTPTPTQAYELAFARKNRAPSLLERYLWTPLSASAGQADGRTYLGNLELESETSHQLAATADWQRERWQVKVTPFYNFVTGYIQGTPMARLDAAGRPVLQYRNLGRADLYGAEGLARYDFNAHFSVRGLVSFVRGINRDTGDNLYRLAPLRGAIQVEHRWGGWNNEVEVELVDDQNHVAAYNQEPPTPGYALLHLRTGYAFSKQLRVQLGLENVFDTHYADHLGGINRVLDSDVPAGARLPQAGRTVYVQAAWNF